MGILGGQARQQQQQQQRCWEMLCTPQQMPSMGLTVDLTRQQCNMERGSCQKIIMIALQINDGLVLFFRP